MQIRMHTGVSLDGFAATPDGVPALDAMSDFVPGESHGLPDFIEQCTAVVVGRATFDEGHAYWSENSLWPWEGKRVYVLTSRPLPERLPDDVVASEGRGGTPRAAYVRAAFGRRASARRTADAPGLP